MIWLSFSPSEARLKNPNAERRRSRSLAFWICEASEASVHKLAKARGCFEGSRQCILSREKTTPWQIPNETVWPRKLLPPNVTKINFCNFQPSWHFWKENLSNFKSTVTLYTGIVTPHSNDCWKLDCASLCEANSQCQLLSVCRYNDLCCSISKVHLKSYHQVDNSDVT